MRALIDNNILLDVALERLPFAGASAAVLDAAEAGRIEAWLALHTLANFHCIFTGGTDSAGARKFVGDLLRFADVAECGTAHVEKALALRMDDFADALQCAAAMACHADFIITRNLSDFRRSPIPAITPDQALRKLST